MALGLVGTRKRECFPLPVCAKPLGRLTIADVFEEGDALRYRSSLRHEEIVVEVRLGPPGAWKQWTFGAMMAAGSQALMESSFQWNHTAGKLASPAAEVLVNWVAVSSGSEAVFFDWSAD